MHSLRFFTSLGLAAVLLGACQGAPAEPTTTPRSTPSASATSPPTEAKESWRKDRYIPVAEAVERLQRHVDIPITLPRMSAISMRGLKTWLADPRYLDWAEKNGEQVGELRLVKGDKKLLISYGAATFDGCGGRDHAVETDVLGQPALVSQAREALWSAIIWPVTPEGSSGRYGLTGTFEAWQLVRLAESMELERLEAVSHPKGC